MEPEDIEVTLRKSIKKFGGGPEFSNQYGSLGYTQLQSEKPNKIDFYIYKQELYKKLRNYTVGLGLSLTIVIALATIYLRLTLGE
jgi:hypothetical protein